MPNLNITNLPGSRQAVLNPDGTMDRVWYNFFFNLFTLTGGGTSDTTIGDLLVVPSITTAEDPTGPQALQEVESLPVPVPATTADLQTVLSALQGLSVGPSPSGGTFTSITAGTGLTTSPSPITTGGTISTSGAYTANGYTLATARLLGRTTAATGAAEEISVDASLSFATTTLAIDLTHANTWSGAQTLNKPITPALTFATLPAAPVAGQRSFITDATSTTFLAAAAGGGANKVPVVYDGAAWVLG